MPEIASPNSNTSRDGTFLRVESFSIGDGLVPMCQYSAVSGCMTDWKPSLYLD